LSDDRTASSSFEPASYYGQSGYDPILPQMKTALIIQSPGIMPDTMLSDSNIVDIVSTLAQLLDLPVHAADGQPIDGIFP
jgi:predicted AlkP superfamily pyrophosphatase or phosphodiesterase